MLGEREPVFAACLAPRRQVLLDGGEFVVTKDICRPLSSAAQGTSQPLEAGQARQQSCPAALLAFLSHFSGPRVSGTLSGFAMSHPGGRSHAGLTRSLSHTGLNPAPRTPAFASSTSSLPTRARSAGGSGGFTRGDGSPGPAWPGQPPAL